MSQAASQAAAFRREVVEGDEVWVVEDDEGVVAPEAAEGRRSMPFWSSRVRAERVVASVPAFAGCRVRRLSVMEFESKWLPGLEADGLLVGVNWSGPRATGYDVEPTDIVGWLEAERGATEHQRGRSGAN